MGTVPQGGRFETWYLCGRYSIMKDDCYVPAIEDISYQSLNNKQGRSDEKIPDEVAFGIQKKIEDQQKEIFSGYNDLITENIARELARINLPLSTYTEWYWQIDLHNLFHFLRLRCDGHAQKEIRDYASIMLDITRRPMSSTLW